MSESAARKSPAAADLMDFIYGNSFSNDDIGGSSFRFILMGEPFPVGVARIVYGNGVSRPRRFALLFFTENYDRRALSCGRCPLIFR